MLSVRQYHDALCIESDNMALNKNEVMEACSAFTRRFGGTDSNGVMIVLRELITNAIEHGIAPLAPIVSIELRLARESLCKIVISDSGPGFDYDKLDLDSIQDDPRCIPNRGYRLIRSFANRLEFNDQGNCITAYVPLVTTHCEQ